MTTTGCLLQPSGRLDSESREASAMVLQLAQNVAGDDV